MGRNVTWNGGPARPGNLAGHEGGGPGAEVLNLASVCEGTGKNQPNVGERRGAGGEGSSGSASSSSPGSKSGTL